MSEVLYHLVHADIFRPHEIGSRVFLHIIGTKYDNDVIAVMVSDELDELEAVYLLCVKLTNNQDIYSLQIVHNLLSTSVELDIPVAIDRSEF